MYLNVFIFPACLSDRDGHNLEREKENYPSHTDTPSVSPKSSKSKWLDPSESSHFEMTDNSVPMFTWSAADQEVLNHCELYLTAINN